MYIVGKYIYFIGKSFRNG